uniref:Small ribosomal subunit protein mS23 n=1 Tax=Rhizochromulina marina TaxID=1034831 RepID=A0A7S2WQK0_9STRA|mmetsp:Transcript_3111/g.8980  ORF Transcript_3111/g.8980 Transcript_3111/m.8980 type:complete len:583 (+) Transcript_3111:79-1827(+)
MSGRFTGMRHLKLKQHIMDRVTARVRAGLLDEPTWLKGMKRTPPLMPPPRARRGIPRIVLPTDRLYRMRAREAPEEASQPVFEAGEVRSATLLFAQRQLKLMEEEAISETEAYRRVEQEMEAMREDSLAQVKSMTMELQAFEEVDTVLFSEPEKAAQYAKWKQRVVDEPYQSWDYTQQISLDTWIVKQVLQWTWEQERYLRDPLFREELDLLRGCLFPEIAAQLEAERAAQDAEAMAQEDSSLDLAFEEEELRRLAKEDPTFDERVHQWYARFATFSSWVYEKPDFTKWGRSEQDTLDEWILTECLPARTIATQDEVTALAALKFTRYHLFPQLDPERADDKVTRQSPDDLEVRQMVAASMGVVPNKAQGLDGRTQESAPRVGSETRGEEGAAPSATPPDSNASSFAVFSSLFSSAPPSETDASTEGLSHEDRPYRSTPDLEGVRSIGDHEEQGKQAGEGSAPSTTVTAPLPQAEMDPETRRVMEEVRSIEAQEQAVWDGAMAEREWMKRQRAIEVLTEQRKLAEAEERRNLALDWALPHLTDEQKQKIPEDTDAWAKRHFNLGMKKRERVGKKGEVLQEED